MSAHANHFTANPQQSPRDADRVASDQKPIAAPSQPPIDVYGNLTPQQTRAVAKAFILQMRGLNDDQARKYATLHPDHVLPAQLNEMHRLLSYNYPEALRDVMREPEAASILGGFAQTEHHRAAEDAEGQSPQA